MNVRRAAATAATALAALITGGLLLASGRTASAQDRPVRTAAPAPGMVRMHGLMTQQNPGMARVRQLMAYVPR